MLKGNALIVQSGGPTPVINQSLVGVVLAANAYSNKILEVLGAQHGIQGVLHEDFLNLSSVDKDSWLKIANSPGSALGTARIKPKENDIERILKIFRAHNIKFLFYIGGNDSAEAVNIISSGAKKQNFDINILHIPKTIDNDLMITDHCPGYGSVAKIVSHIIAGEDLDNRSFYNSIKINIVMGRHAGWVAGASALAKKIHRVTKNEEEIGPHLIYFPEIEFSEKAFLKDVQKVYDELGKVNIVVSEGIADQIKKNMLGEVDEFGNYLLSGSGKLGDYLVDLIKNNLNYKKNYSNLRIRSDTLGYLQRSCVGMASNIDQKEAFLLGEMAVHYMMKGETDKMLCLHRVSNNPYKVEIKLCDLQLVAQKTKFMPRNMINLNANGVTNKFYEYILPLIGDLPEIKILKALKISPKLDEYTRVT